jgi:hypothetical protein
MEYGTDRLPKTEPQLAGVAVGYIG